MQFYKWMILIFEADSQYYFSQKAATKFKS